MPLRRAASWGCAAAAVGRGCARLPLQAAGAWALLGAGWHVHKCAEEDDVCMLVNSPAYHSYCRNLCRCCLLQVEPSLLCPAPAPHHCTHVCLPFPPPCTTQAGGTGVAARVGAPAQVGGPGVWAQGTGPTGRGRQQCVPLPHLRRCGAALPGPGGDSGAWSKGCCGCILVTQQAQCFRGRWCRAEPRQVTSRQATQLNVSFMRLLLQCLRRRRTQRCATRCACR